VPDGTGRVKHIKLGVQEEINQESQQNQGQQNGQAQFLFGLHLGLIITVMLRIKHRQRHLDYWQLVMFFAEI
jgi:hypothetical protein